ncbi:MAG: D-aminoacyl-tRNA deacylase [Treponema sp.]|nr:D-aminoacyl-tRNA deacylase [Treponema sp.]
MKAVVQRVKNARVTVDGSAAGKIERGLLVYVGVAVNDSEKDASRLAEKIANLRIFPDACDKMNLSILDVNAADINADEKTAGVNTDKTGAGILAVSQFTLLGDCVKGRRPYYGNAAEPQTAKYLYELFMDKIREQGIVCEAGVFQTHMSVESINDGPVTILLDTELFG